MRRGLGGRPAPYPSSHQRLRTEKLSTLPSDCDFTWYPGTQGTNDVSFTEFIFPRDYWVDFRVEVRASQNGPSLGTATYRVDGAGEGDGGGCSPCLVSRPDSSADR